MHELTADQFGANELTDEEMDQASGGILPVIGFGLALAGKASGSAGVIGWAIGSASLIVASYDLARFLNQR